MRSEEVRGKILQALYNADQRTGGRGQIERDQLAQQLAINPVELKSGLSYLLDKKYITSQRVSVRPLIYIYFQINAEGIDIIEYRADDTGVSTDSYRSELHKLLTQYFNTDELRTLCYDLSVDHDSLGGEGKAGKARELILYMLRLKRIRELVEYCVRQRPTVGFEAILEAIEHA